MERVADHARERALELQFLRVARVAGVVAGLGVVDRRIRSGRAEETENEADRRGGQPAPQRVQGRQQRDRQWQQQGYVGKLEGGRQGCRENREYHEGGLARPAGAEGEDQRREQEGRGDGVVADVGSLHRVDDAGRQQPHPRPGDPGTHAEQCEGLEDEAGQQEEADEVEEEEQAVGAEQHEWHRQHPLEAAGGDVDERLARALDPLPLPLPCPVEEAWQAVGQGVRLGGGVETACEKGCRCHQEVGSRQPASRPPAHSLQTSPAPMQDAPGSRPTDEPEPCREQGNGGQIAGDRQRPGRGKEPAGRLTPGGENDPARGFGPGKAPGACGSSGGLEPRRRWSESSLNFSRHCTAHRTAQEGRMSLNLLRFPAIALLDIATARPAVLATGSLVSSATCDLPEHRGARSCQPGGRRGPWRRMSAGCNRNARASGLTLQEVLMHRFALAIFLILAGLAAPRAEGQEVAALEPQTLAGTWTVDLRPTPDSEPYFQEFTLEWGDEGPVGTFYGTSIEEVRTNTAWGVIWIAFVTRDGSGAYHTTAKLVGDRLEGTTHSLGRGFLSPWTAVRSIP